MLREIFLGEVAGAMFIVFAIINLSGCPLLGCFVKNTICFETTTAEKQNANLSSCQKILHANQHVSYKVLSSSVSLSLSTS